MLEPDIIGRTSAPGLNEVEKGAIRRFAEAIGDPNPLFRDERYARAAGFRSLVAPPTFPITFTAGSDVREGLELEGRQVLHSEQVFEYERPIVAGDAITVVRRITDVQDHSGPSGRVEMLTVEEEGSDPAGKVIYRARRVEVVRS